MKLKLLGMVLLIGIIQANGQTLSEWTRQKKKQIQYLEQQVVALEAGIHILKSGYDLVHKGLLAIGTANQEEFKMHDIYFSRLSSVSPGVKEYGRISDILQIKDKAFRVGDFLTGMADDNEELSAEEFHYILRVVGGLREDANGILAVLEKVITPGVYVMKDWERISAINSLYDQMKAGYVFAMHFSNQVRMLVLQRSQVHQDATLERLW